MMLLQNNEFDQLYKELNSFYVKTIFPYYNREYIRLNALMLQGNKEAINKQFEILIPMTTGKKARKDILNKAFEYYVFEQDKECCDPIFKMIKEFGDEEFTKNASVLYDIFILKKSNHIEEFEKGFENLDKFNKVTIATLLIEQYKNKGDLEKAQYYETLSKNIVEGK